MKKVLSVFLFGLILMMTIVSLCCCKSVLEDDENAEMSLTVLSWNVQALFDGEDQGSEYTDYSLSKGW
jgi:hypothetical protein